MLSLPSARQGWEKTNGTMKGVLQKSGWLSCEAYLSRGHLAHRNEAPDRLWWCVQVKGELRRIRVGQDLFWIFVVAWRIWFIMAEKIMGLTFSIKSDAQVNAGS